MLQVARGITLKSFWIPHHDLYCGFGLLFPVTTFLRQKTARICATIQSMDSMHFGTINENKESICSYLNASKWSFSFNFFISIFFFFFNCYEFTWKSNDQDIIFTFSNWRNHNCGWRNIMKGHIKGKQKSKKKLRTFLYRQNICFGVVYLIFFFRFPMLQVNEKPVHWIETIEKNANH